jgi:hypothetical protein
MDDWAWEQLAPWLQTRVALPISPLFCVVTGATRGRPWSASAAPNCGRPRGQRTAALRAAPTPPCACGREGVPLIVIQRQLGHYVGDRRSPRPSGSHNAGSMRVIGPACYLAITRISNTPTSTSRRSTSRASTTRRSSTRSMPVAPRWCPCTARCASDRRTTQPAAGSWVPARSSSVSAASGRTSQRAKHSSFAESRSVTLRSRSSSAAITCCST